MASNVEQSPFFLQQKAKGEIIVKGMRSANAAFPVCTLTCVDPPKFDLESYIANYSGMPSILT